MTKEEINESLAKSLDAFWIDPAVETGYGLDAIGAREDVKLPRSAIEPDSDYRKRLVAKLREITGLDTPIHWAD